MKAGELCQLIQVAPGVMQIHLNRAEKANALNREILTSWLQHLEDLSRQPTVPILLLTAAGENFSAGADISPSSGLIQAKIGQALDLGDVLKQYFQPVADALFDYPSPVIAVVQGNCVGIAMAYVLHADMIMADSSTSFWLNFTSMGLVPDGGSTFWGLRSLGYHHLTRLALCAEKLSAQQALQCGLVSTICAAEELEVQALSLARHLATHSNTALVETKKLLRQSLSQAYQQQCQAEMQAQTKCGQSPEFISAVTKFYQAKK